MIFQLANWIILGGAFYLLFGQLSKKLWSGKNVELVEQTGLATKIIVLSGTLVLFMQFVAVIFGGYYFFFEDMPMNIGGKPGLFPLMFLIPLVTQLFRIKAFANQPIVHIILPALILGLDLFFRFYNPLPTPRRHFTSSRTSIFNLIENNLFLHYLCSIVLFCLILGILLAWKNKRSKHTDE